MPADPKRHPSLTRLLDDLIAFMDSKGYGQFTVTIKAGRIVHILESKSVPVFPEQPRQSEERSQAAPNGKESSRWPSTS